VSVLSKPVALQDNIQLLFSDDALMAIAEEAFKKRTGARGLKSVMVCPSTGATMTTETLFSTVIEYCFSEQAPQVSFNQTKFFGVLRQSINVNLAGSNHLKVWVL
jgi:hypothetical protein